MTQWPIQIVPSMHDPWPIRLVDKNNTNCTIPAITPFRSVMALIEPATACGHLWTRPYVSSLRTPRINNTAEVFSSKKTKCELKTHAHQSNGGIADSYWLCRCRILLVFTARRYAIVRYVPSSCVCPSLRSRCSTKTAKPRIMQTRPYDSPGTLVYCCQWSRRNFIGVTPTAAENRGIGENRRFSTSILHAISQKRCERVT